MHDRGSVVGCRAKARVRNIRFKIGSNFLFVPTPILVGVRVDFGPVKLVSAFCSRALMLVKQSERMPEFMKHRSLDAWYVQPFVWKPVRFDIQRCTSLNYI